MGRAISKKVIEEIKELRDAGKTFGTIREQTGVSLQTIMKYVNRPTPVKKLNLPDAKPRFYDKKEPAVCGVGKDGDPYFKVLELSKNVAPAVKRQKKITLLPTEKNDVVVFAFLDALASAWVSWRKINE